MFKLKSFIYGLITKIFSVYKICKVKNIILFESLPSYSDNSKFIFDELIERKINEKFIIYWIVNDGDGQLIPLLKNVKVLDLNAGGLIKRIFARARLTKLEYTAKVFIMSNKFLYKRRDGQRSINLAHGAALKNCSGHYNLPDCVDSVMCLSNYLAEFDAVNFNCDEEKMLPLGYPRNDLLFGEKIDLHKFFSAANFDKAVYWMPTYRQHKNGKYNTSSISFPIIYDEKIAERISQKAAEERVLIIIKPHPAQDMSRITKLNLQNIVFIDNEFLSKNRLENYELLRSVDALISDYSSVYYDYLLCDKPIGLCFDDFEEYSSNEGFTVDPDFILAGGEKLYNAQDLMDFIGRIAVNQDILIEKRNEIKKLCHTFCDNKSTQRVTDYILEQLNNY